MGRVRDAETSHVFTKMSRIMSDSLSQFMMRWRFIDSDIAMHKGSFDDYVSVQKRDVIEALLSYVFWLHRKPGELEILPPSYLRSEEFMWKALQIRMKECIDDPKLDEEERYFEDQRKMNEDRLERWERIWQKSQSGEMTPKQVDAEIEKMRKRYPVEN